MKTMQAKSAGAARAEKGSGVRIEAMGNQAAEIYLYGEFGWEIQASDFRYRFEDLGPITAVKVRINSFGGSVLEALPIYNLLKEHPAEVTVQIDGFALSAGSYVAMAGDKVIMPQNTTMMIHDPAMSAWGNAEELKKMSDFLDRHADQLMLAYAEKSGTPPDKMRDMMREEVWMTAAEAVDMGFADELVEPLDMTAMVKPDISAFKKVPLHIVNLFKTEEEDPMKMQANATTTQTAQAEPVQVVTTTAPTASTAQAVPEQAGNTDIAMAAERERSTAIFDLGMRHGVIAGDITKMISSGLTVIEAKARILDANAALTDAAPSAAATSVEMVEDGQDKFRQGVELSLLNRAGIGGERNEFVGMTLTEIARESLKLHGVKSRGMNRMEMVGSAFTLGMGAHNTSDFTHILGNVANQSMLRGAEEVEEVFPLFTYKGTLTDFKVASRVDLDHFPSLQQVNEGAEYKNVTIGDSAETLKLATYGNVFAITRHAIVNDDMDAFTKIPRRFGRAARRTVGDLVFAQLTSNPVMADGKELFHVDHKNLSGATGITSDSLDGMRVAMATQKSGQATLGIRPRFLLVPVALQGTASSVVAGEYHSEKGDKKIPNPVRDSFEVISDSRLDANSATKWYGAADANVQDTIEVSYLDGNEMPFLENRDGWRVDGTEFKVRIDAVAKALSAKGLHRNG
ncbi:ClpP-like prohead protease/major capsid protein fusion protein [Kiloniella sp.]|uniref:ClpP-like prohead protease/major capsid protein fusion protein n=1 Tax=Kiloniella sp. TaxID=1938587 RepID=UPI003B015F4A